MRQLGVCCAVPRGLLVWFEPVEAIVVQRGGWRSSHSPAILAQLPAFARGYWSYTCIHLNVSVYQANHFQLSDWRMGPQTNLIPGPLPWHLIPGVPSPCAWGKPWPYLCSLSWLLISPKLLWLTPLTSAVSYHTWIYHLPHLAWYTLGLYVITSSSRVKFLLLLHTSLGFQLMTMSMFSF